tara:strand:+ start:519 stop:1259 length:741 start_codon:yes stop_codon:yes gene_type:complete
MKYCDTTKLSIRQIDKPTAKKMVVKYHYSQLWTKCSVALGLFTQTGSEHAFFDEPEEKMIGVCVYGDPIGRLTGQSISDEIDRTEVLELTRLFIHDGYGSNIESWFISQSFNWLKKNMPEIKALISYASPVEGHCGTIYQATNWIYQGNNNRWNDGWLFKFESDGRWKHGRTIFPYYNSNDPKEIQKKVTEPFWIKKEQQKHRYVYILAGKRDRKKIMKSLKHDTLPYPKQGDIETTEEVRLEPIQ